MTMCEETHKNQHHPKDIKIFKLVTFVFGFTHKSNNVKNFLQGPGEGPRNPWPFLATRAAGSVVCVCFKPLVKNFF